jgi:hypothetical protein
LAKFVPRRARDRSHDVPGCLLASARTVDAQAYEYYLRGLHEFNFGPARADRALEYYQLALDRDPNYAPAYTDDQLAQLGLPVGSPVGLGPPPRTLPVEDLGLGEIQREPVPAVEELLRLLEFRTGARSVVQDTQPHDGAGV